MNDKKKLDDFWDIDAIVPKKKSPAVTNTAKIQEISVTGKTNINSSVPLTSAPAKEKALLRATELLCEYKPANPLIKNVKLFKWPSAYNYYEKFKADARYFFSRTGDECEFTPFFSYIPQYHHLTKGQFAFYLWFRDNARQNKYIFCDFSYIMLYIYELINIPEMLTPKETLKRLTGIWVAYRERFPRLDKYLVEWICDFCLINGISPDLDELGTIYKDVVDAASFKEFYVPDATDTRDAYAHAAIASLSNYDFRRSKYAQGENKAAFEDHIVGAIGFAIEENRLFDKGMMKTTTMRRDSFGGALCGSDLKRVIEVEHYSLSGSYELRSIITNAVKYAENSVRAALGIKSRLGNLSVPQGVRESIDRYFMANLTKKKQKEEIPEYERRYALPVSPISSENAKDIERESWKTTKLLVDAFEDTAEEAPVQAIEESTYVAGENVYADLIGILSDEDKEFIRLALKEDFEREKELCQKLSKPIDIIAELINSSAADICGDIILEANETGYTVIEDYKEEIANWIDHMKA